MATDLPEDFCITGPMREWAREKVSGLDIDYHTEEFMDHWRGNGKRKKDWVATWRNWMRRSAHGIFGKPHRLKPKREPLRKTGEINAATLIQAKQRGISTTGKSESELNAEIWRAQQGERGAGGIESAGREPQRLAQRGAARR